MSVTDSGSFDFVDLSALPLEPEAIRRVPRSLAMRHDVLSLSSDGNQLTVALPEPGDGETIDRVRLATGMHVRALQAPREAIRARLSDAYAQGDDPAPAIRTVDEIHNRALRADASDVHIEPAGSGGRVRQRVDGVLSESAVLHRDVYAQVVSRIKLLAGMDIADRRQPQDGRYAIELRGRSLDARVSSMPSIQGEKLAIRLLDHRARVPSLDSIGMPPDQLAEFRRTIHVPYGLAIVCGPTGSGKTTTPYAAVAERNVSSENLCSVEDPVEVRLPGVTQVQINPRAGVTFASALRAFLRQDPNLIMVGEVRDAETAAVVASASLSGQLMLGTLHSNDALGAVERLVELGIARRTVAAGLSAVVAQRLVRRLCPKCRRPEESSPSCADEFGVAAGTEVFSAAGCSNCSGSGYSGRAAVFESMVVGSAVRAAIATGAPGPALADLARKSGYRPMLVHGRELVTSGETTFDELRRVLPIERVV